MQRLTGLILVDLLSCQQGLDLHRAEPHMHNAGVALLLWVCQGQRLDGAVASGTLDHILCKQRLRKSDEDETLAAVYLSQA